MPPMQQSCIGGMEGARPFPRTALARDLQQKATLRGGARAPKPAPQTARLERRHTSAPTAAARAQATIVAAAGGPYVVTNNRFLNTNYRRVFDLNGTETVCVATAACEYTVRAGALATAVKRWARACDPRRAAVWGALLNSNPTTLRAPLLVPMAAPRPRHLDASVHAQARPASRGGPAAPPSLPRPPLLECEHADGSQPPVFCLAPLARPRLTVVRRL
jgi:hypothetical protein